MKVLIKPRVEVNEEGLNVEEDAEAIALCDLWLCQPVWCDLWECNIAEDKSEDDVLF